MKVLNAMYVKVSEKVAGVVGARSCKAQTMTEYALILAAVAIVVYVTYQVMGQDIGSLVSKVDSALSNA